MTPSTAIEGSKTFSLALSLKSLAKQSVRAVHLIGTPHTKLLRFNFSLAKNPWQSKVFGWTGRV